MESGVSPGEGGRSRRTGVNDGAGGRPDLALFEVRVDYKGDRFRGACIHGNETLVIGIGSASDWWFY